MNQADKAKYQGFLWGLYFAIKNGSSGNFADLCKIYKIGNPIKKCLQQMDIIEIHGRGRGLSKWEWIGRQPDEDMIDELINHHLEFKKSFNEKYLKKSKPKPTMIQKPEPGKFELLPEDQKVAGVGWISTKQLKALSDTNRELANQLKTIKQDLETIEGLLKKAFPNYAIDQKQIS